MAGEPILIVDDNPSNVKLLDWLLRSRGFVVRSASDGEEMFAILAEFRPHLILMDVQLPRRDGLTLTRLLRASPDTASILIVALTAYAMHGDEERILAAGCDGYLSKPIDVRSLPATIAAMLVRGR